MSSPTDNTPLRILFHINDFGRGGTETALLAWLNTLDRTQFAPDVSVAYPTDDLEFWRARSIPSDVDVHVLASERWMHALHQVKRVRKLRGALGVWHRVLTYAAIRPLMALRLKRLARQYDVICDFDFSLRHVAGSGDAAWFGVSHFSLATRLRGKSAAHVARRVRQYTRYGAVAVLAPDMLQEARQLFAGQRTQVVQLPNVIDVDAIRRRAEEPVERPAASFIVSVARLDEGQKDHTTLLRAYAKARASGNVSATLVLIGEGKDRAVLEQLAQTLGIAPFTRFLGFCANPFPYIRQADMLVLSSRYEGLPMALSEAMALGTPVISSDCPTGPRDQLEHGEAGLLVAPGDVDAMAEAIERLSTDARLRAALTQRALTKVETFGPESANRRLLELVREIGARRGYG
jgi:glycosyltransferase involved in cell wall biosynthesis